MTEPQSFEAQHVVITGAGSGIGRLMALGATQRGAAHVVLWDRDLSAAQSVVQEIAALGGAASAYKVDISQRAAVMKTASTVLEKIGHLDVLINNAGIVIGKKFLELDESDVTSTYAVNTLALYWTTAAFLPGMLERDTGRVVTICLLYTSPSPRDRTRSRMPSSA